MVSKLKQRLCDQIERIREAKVFCFHLSSSLSSVENLQSPFLSLSPYISFFPSISPSSSLLLSLLVSVCVFLQHQHLLGFLPFPLPFFLFGPLSLSLPPFPIRARALSSLFVCVCVSYSARFKEGVRSGVPFLSPTATNRVSVQSRHRSSARPSPSLTRRATTGSAWATSALFSARWDKILRRRT